MRDPCSEVRDLKTEKNGQNEGTYHRYFHSRDHCGLLVSRVTSYESPRDLVASVSNAWDRAPVSVYAYANDVAGRRARRLDRSS